MMKKTLAITAAAVLAISLTACSAEMSVGETDTYRTRGSETITATDTMYNGSTPGTNGTGMNAGASAGSDTGMFDVTGTDGERGAAGGTAFGTGSVAGAMNRANRGSTAYSGYTATNNGGYLSGGGRTGSIANADGADSVSGGRYRLMLENGRVHDTDGYLFDGENTHYRTF